MLVPIIFQLLCLVTLITGIPLAPRQGPGSGKVIIGYKNLKPELAEKYNKAKTMVWDDPNGQQIGWGVYLSTGPGEWKGYEWNCAVWADLEKWEAVPKVWIPEEDVCGNPLLGQNGEFGRNKYVKELGHDPEKTVFISQVYDYYKKVYQVLVKPNMLKGKANDLGLGATCAKKTVLADGETENLHLDVTVPADWQSWDIEGLPEDL